MREKKILILGALTLVLLAYFVLAAAGDGIKITSPSSGSNYTSFRGTIFNVTVINASDIPNPLNATFLINISGWSKIGNTSATACSLGTNLFCGVNLTNTTIADGTYLINATIYNASASISINNASNLSTIIIDGTAPQASSSNFSNPSSLSNYSQKLMLNISVFDATIGVATVLFNITNASSGLQNSTVTATREGSSNNYAVEINTSHYPNGIYNITVYANDSLNNLNNTAKITTLIFDNSLPVVTYTCTDYTVDEDDVMDCTCTASDSPANINLSYGSNGVSFTASPSTANSGNNQQATCTAQDTAGNYNSSTIYYNVSSGGTSGSSSGSSSGSTSSNKTNSKNSTSSSTSSSSNQTTNITTTQNELQGNQFSLDGLKNIKINYWILSATVILAGLIVSTVIIFKKTNLLDKIKNLNFIKRFK